MKTIWDYIKFQFQVQACILDYFVFWNKKLKMYQYVVIYAMPVNTQACVKHKAAIVLGEAFGTVNISNSQFAKEKMKKLVPLENGS